MRLKAEINALRNVVAAVCAKSGIRDIDGKTIPELMVARYEEQLTNALVDPEDGTLQRPRSCRGISIGRDDAEVGSRRKASGLRNNPRFEQPC